MVLKDPDGRATGSAVSNSDGMYAFPSVQPGSYVVEVEAKGFKHIASPALEVGAGQTATFDCTLSLAEPRRASPSPPTWKTPIAWITWHRRAARHDAHPGSALLRQRDFSPVDRRHAVEEFKEAAKYLPLVSFQEMQGPEVLRPETRGMQGSNMQNDRKDGMGIAVTTPSALEEYEQIEVVNGLGGPLYGPANPSGIFNFVTKRPTEEPLREFELDYEGNSVGTAHVDLGGRVRQEQDVRLSHESVARRWRRLCHDSQLRRQLAAVAVDVRPPPTP